MVESIEDYPALRMEDEGFLMSVKMDFVEIREELFGASEGKAFPEIVEGLVGRNACCTDKGSSLPLYLPLLSDDGEIVGSRSVPVWSGAHVGFALYPGLEKGCVERYIYGNPWIPGRLGKAFLECDPAFRLALLVHYMLENVLIGELSAEAFLLGAYEELPFSDERYEKTGLPSTKLVSVRSTSSTATTRMVMPDGSLCVSHGSGRTCGWAVRVRGSRPKERVMRDCWQEMREIESKAGEKRFEVGGVEYRQQKLGESGRTRTRSGSPSVDCMVAWVDALYTSGMIPRRGSRIDWVEVKRMFEGSCPEYTNYWTADTMRRTYKRRMGHGASNA